MLEYNSHLPMDVLLGEGTKAVCAFGRERKVDLELAGVVAVAIFRGAAQVATSHYRSAAQHIPSFSRGCARIPAFGAARNQFRAWRQNAAVGSQRRRLRRVGCRVLDQFQLQLTARLNYGFGARGIAFTRQLNENFVVFAAMALNGGF